MEVWNGIWKKILEWNGICKKILVWNGRFLVWNGNGMEENCQYGIWKNRLPFHSIPCPSYGTLKIWHVLLEYLVVKNSKTLGADLAWSPQCGQLNFITFNLWFILSDPIDLNCVALKLGGDGNTIEGSLWYGISKLFHIIFLPILKISSV